MDFLFRWNVNDYSLLIAIVHTSLERKKSIWQKRSIYKVYSEEQESIWYVFGIIDTLTDFDGLKKMEYFSKRVFLGPGVSCIPPKEYKERFMKMIRNVFQIKQE